MSNTVDPVLVGRAQVGDLRALDTLLTSIQAPLFRHLATILRDDHAAEDALQDSLFTISRRLGTLRDPQWFRAWAYRIATREGVKHSRRNRRLPSTSDSAIEQLESVEEVPAFDADLIEQIPDAINALPPASQLVLRMHYLDGLTYVEIAEALELSVGTIKSRLAYGLGILRKTVKR